jgi:hypothetical protein
MKLLADDIKKTIRSVLTSASEPKTCHAQLPVTFPTRNQNLRLR